MFDERRRDSRFTTHLTTTFHQRFEAHAMVTQNVSFHGLLLYAQPAPPLGQLLRLTLALPGEEPVTVHGVPVRCVAMAHGRSFAVGVRLLGAPSQWDRYV